MPKKQTPNKQSHLPRKVSQTLAERVLYSRAGAVGIMLLAVVALGMVMAVAYQSRGDLIAPDLEILDAAKPASQQVLERRVRRLTVDHPITSMAELIAEQDQTVAAYLVSIAKKESNWGKRVPVDAQGHDCYNYWGYRDPDNMLGSGGHTCFTTPRQAVRTVAQRIHTLVYEEGRETPAEMIVWKCGYHCDDDAENVIKWQQDVGYYFHKIIPGKK